MSELPERLKRIRNVVGVSQKVLSKRLNIGTNAWSRYETGKNMPGVDLIEALAKIGFNGHWVATGEGYPLNKATSSFLTSPFRVTADIVAELIGEDDGNTQSGLAEEQTSFHPGEMPVARISDNPYIPALIRLLIVSAQRTEKEKARTEGRACSFREIADLVVQMYDALAPVYASGKNRIDYDSIDQPGDFWPVPPEEDPEADTGSNTPEVSKPVRRQRKKQRG